jgi:hypothetical protein
VRKPSISYIKLMLLNINLEMIARRLFSLIFFAVLLCCGCDVFNEEEPLERDTFEAKASGVVRAEVEGEARFIVYGSGEDLTVIFYFLSGTSELPAPNQTNYDPTGIFIRTRWYPGTKTAIRLPVDPVLHDRMVLEDGRRFLMVDGFFTITESEDGRAIGEFSMLAIIPASDQPPFLITGRFNAAQAPAL